MSRDDKDKGAACTLEPYAIQRRKMLLLYNEPLARAVCLINERKRYKTQDQLAAILLKSGSAKRANIFPSTGALSSNVKTRLREVFGISLASLCWEEFVNDDDADSIDEFWLEFQKIHRDVDVAILDISDDVDASDLYKAVRGNAPPALHSAFSVDLTFPREAFKEGAAFGIDAVCNPALLPEVGLEIIITRVTLRLRASNNTDASIDFGNLIERRKKLDACLLEIGRNHNLSVYISGPANAPVWEFETLEGSAVGELPLNEIVQLFGVAAEPHLRIDMELRDADLVAQPSTNAYQAIDPTKSHVESVLLADGTSLGTSKARILSILAAKALEDNHRPSEGVLVLASNSARIIGQE